MAMTITYQKLGPVVKVTGAWTSNGSGAATGTTAVVMGELVKGITIPSGTAAPTADYDITITDGASVNVLGLCEDDLADRHTSNTEEVYFLIPNLAATDPGGVVHPVVADPLTITVANAGDTKAGTVILYVKGYIHGG